MFVFGIAQWLGCLHGSLTHFFNVQQHNKWLKCRNRPSPRCCLTRILQRGPQITQPNGTELSIAPSCSITSTHAPKRMLPSLCEGIQEYSPWLYDTFSQLVVYTVYLQPVVAATKSSTHTNKCDQTPSTNPSLDQ